MSPETIIVEVSRTMLNINIMNKKIRGSFRSNTLEENFQKSREDPYTETTREGYPCRDVDTGSDDPSLVGCRVSVPCKQRGNDYGLLPFSLREVSRTRFPRSTTSGTTKTETVRVGSHVSLHQGQKLYD